MAPETITFLLTPNGKYAQHAAALVASLLEHSQAPLEIMIAATEDPESFADRFRRSFGANERISLAFKQFRLPPDVNFPTTDKLSTEMYIRFWAHELLPGRSRVIYLDSDIIAIGGVDELWHTDLGGKALAAVPIPNSIRIEQHGLPPGSQYFNSGVLLMDLDAWRARGYCARCLEFIRNHPDRAFDPDQDALNLVLIGDWLALPYKWNVINPFYRPSISLDLKMSKEEIAGVLADARFVHFNSSHKPWVYLDNHPKQGEYMRYLRQTDWRDWQPPDRTPVNMVRKQLSRVLPPWVKQAGKALLKRAG
ncbi:MAG: glycosyltransferase family 8 protein [Acetobacteraceae bacterium]|nr:glycosyltransferase family 8 protein [Acetobacteraceae bacterium]